MSNRQQLQLSGLAGMPSAVIWLVALVVEYRYGLLPPGNGTPLYGIDQGAFFVAQAGYVVMLLGLWRSNAAGTGRFGRIAVGVWVTGLAALLVAQVVQWLTADPNFFLFPLGGMLQLLGGLLTGIAVATAKRWGGWQRWAPLLQALYFLFVLLLPIILFNQGPSQLAESLWQVTWFITSLALLSQAAHTVEGAAVVAPHRPALDASGHELSR